VDEVVAGIFRTPHSYTGEDVVEFSCHGSPAVLKEILQLCQERGARLARPGEFTERAYRNGKMDLVKAEAVAELIRATSSSAAQAASDQLRGVLSERLQTIRRRLVDLLAHVEANLDFVEEDIPGLPSEKMKTDLTALESEVEQLLATSLKGRLLREGLKVTLAGRPNVGKSSLFNALLASARAIVTDVPGTTRDTLEEKLEWDGFSVVLTDTAGLRDTKSAVEQQGTLRARRAHASAHVVLLVVDGSVKLTAADRKIFPILKKKNSVVLLNKADKKLKVARADIEKLNRDAIVVETSAKTGAGLNEVKKAVLMLAQRDAPEVEGAPTITNLRHVHHLEKTAQHIQKAREALQKKRSEEAVAIDLRQALAELGAITGESVTEDVLSAIFRRFCIGK
jgi:tRNA modification GTPase